ncbi:cryptochrome/photolyase family protein [Bacteroidia bacterium]|nr:cryptochrome/photolyase family protein [Bacteroidia bacterium]
MKKVGLIFPHQLYKESKVVHNCDVVYIIEEHLYFTQYKFHKQKLVLHRASMKYYADLISSDTTVKYIHSNDYQGIGKLFKSLEENEVHCYLTDDYLLERRINRYAKKHAVQLVRYTNPNFINPENDVRDMLSKKKNYFMASFYAESRKKHGILLEDGDKPLGGKWSFDADNRKKVPKGVEIPKVETPASSSYVDEAKKYIEDQFGDNYGDVARFHYAITHADAENHLQRFISERLTLFGDYEDAMVADERWLWHSVLTPMLNVGLLSPKQVIHEVLKAHETHHFPLNSLEGFIRQILGWREFIRGIYSLEGVKQRTTNHFGYSRKIPESFWTGDTGIVPLDQTIKKLLKTGYSHHIERLMLFGNFMMLCEFDPDEVHRWFMEMYVDAYDWVMVPNVYGMTQYADGGLMTTKPYCSGSNYVLKMSDYKKGDWCETWNALYWRFIHVNREEFSKNRRMGMMVNLAKKMEGPKMDMHLDRAEAFLAELDKG